MEFILGAIVLAIGVLIGATVSHMNKKPEEKDI